MLDSLWFTLLGPVRVWDGERELDLGAPQQRAVLAVLLAHAGQPVRIAEIVDSLWWQDPPDSAVNTVHRSIGYLRRALEPQLAPREPGSWLTRAGGGYRLRADAETSDLLRFRRLVEQAHGQDGDPVARFAEALRLWRGTAAEGVSADVRERPVFTAIDREYVMAAREAADATLPGRPDATLLSLVELAADRAVLDEPLQARVVRLLAESGRQTDALERFDKVRAKLRDELGLNPGGELVGARDAVLRPPAATAGLSRPLPRPAQLPIGLPVFVGRAAEIATVQARMQNGPFVVITAIGGMAGIGKTSLALHLAHQVATQFPDGQLYADLRGFGPGDVAVHPSDILRSFLEALGVAPATIPQDLDAQAALFRSKVAGRRFLLLLDNARDTEQVRPLLPGTATSMVIVTSRDRLAGLVVSQGAWPVVLAAMPDNESRRLLSVRLDDERMRAESAAVDEILAACAGLPLGVTIVAAHAATHPDVRLGEISAGLRDATRRLDTLSAGDPQADIRAVFSWSYRQLASAPARMFRLLGLHPAPDISADAAASLAGATPGAAREFLADLVAAGLVTEQPGDRYAMHDLLRSYAAEVAEQIDSEQLRRQAVARLLDHYAQTAYAADRLVSPYRKPPPIEAPLEGVTPTDLTARGGAVDWCRNEQRVLRAAIALAEAHGFDARVWQLGWALADVRRARTGWLDEIDIQSAVVRSVQRLGDLAAEAFARRVRAYPLILLSRFDEAVEDLDTALGIHRRLGDLIGEGRVHMSLGMAYDQRQRHQEALSHAERAAELFRGDPGERLSLANALSAAGWEHAQLGDYERARDLCRQVLPVFEELGDRNNQSSTWDSLGFALQKLGQNEDALDCFSRSLEIAREVGERYGEATALTHRADAYAALNDLPSARRSWQQALAILEDLDHHDAEAVRRKLASPEP
ncbi:tetratricopeptide repeat protein [Micromonospora sp. NPDC047548]|uniref:AfsR/SARP family transcriptional regulator n=1 Tax=Micromonospora sp. NPDC047548 TaxID=3155624 RepID=UPI0033F6A8FA